MRRRTEQDISLLAFVNPPRSDLIKRHSQVLNTAALFGARVGIKGSGLVFELLAGACAGLGIGSLYYDFGDYQTVLFDSVDAFLDEFSITSSYKFSEGKGFSVVADGSGSFSGDAVRFGNKRVFFGSGTFSDAATVDYSSLESIIFAASAADMIRHSVSADLLDLVVEDGDSFCYDIATSSLSGARIMIVGGGATGTYAALGSALLGADVDIFDGDSVDFHNLNRQLLYFDAIGEPKASSLADKLSPLSKGRVRGFVSFIDESSVSLMSGYDVVLSCVDNNRTRRLLNDYAVGNGISLVDGGTGPFSGSAAAYSPGLSSCIACRRPINYPDSDSSSCSLSEESSVIIPNMIIGAVMVDLAGKVLNGTVDNSVFHYDSRIIAKNYFNNQSPNIGCNCEVVFNGLCQGDLY